MQHWIIPCNIKCFDIFSHFSANNTVVWKDISHIQKGDIVYIYVGAPYSKIAFQCVVTDDCVSREKLLQNSYALPARPISKLYKIKFKYIEMQCLRKYDEDLLKLNVLREYGLVQVQVQAKVSSNLQDFIDTI